MLKKNFHIRKILLETISENITILQQNNLTTFLFKNILILAEKLLEQYEYDRLRFSLDV